MSSYDDIQRLLVSSPHEGQRDSISINHGNQLFKENCSAEYLNEIFDESSHQVIQHDIVRMILQYLSENGFHTAAVVLQEESGMVSRDDSNRNPMVKDLRFKVINGDWEGTESILKEHFDERHQRPLLYQVYREVYLEFISRSEFQKGLQYLYKVIKPIEEISNTFGQQEFLELCYLLTLKSIQSSAYFLHWPGVHKAREILADRLSCEFMNETVLMEKPIPDNHLVKLLKQACLYQTLQQQNPILLQENEQYVFPRMTSLLEDYHQLPLPCIFHDESPSVTGSIKSCISLSSQHHIIAAKSSLYLWNGEQDIKTIGTCGGTIWDLSLSCDSKQVISGSSDGVIRIWSVPLLQETTEPLAFTSNQGDIYTVAAHPLFPSLLLSGGFDGSSFLWNIEQKKVVKQYVPHTNSLTAITTNPAGNLAISGGKDRRLAVWDLVNLCEVTVVDKNLKEITGVDCSACGNLVAVADRSNSHHLVDLRTNNIELSFRGVMNTRSNYLRIHFLNDAYVYSGNENGSVGMWDLRTKRCVSTLKAPRGSGPVLDCCYVKENGHMIAGTDSGRLCVWNP